jgi:carboxylesterase
MVPDHRRLDDLDDPSRPLPEAEQAALVVHGFTGTPFEMASLVPPLAASGWSVEVPRLPGHGTHPRDLTDVRARDWQAFVAERYRRLRARHRRVAVIGLSMGGALARSLLAEPVPPDVVVSLAAPWRLADPMARRLLPWLRRSRVAAHLAWLKDGGSDLLDPVAAADPVNYRWAPLSAVAELDRLLRRLRRPIKARAPLRALVLHGRADHTALPDGAPRVLAAFGPQAQGYWLPRSGHVVTRDLEQAEVARIVAAFCQAGVVPRRLPAGWTTIERV